MASSISTARRSRRKTCAATSAISTKPANRCTRSCSTRGEKEKIKNTHVAALASLSRDLKITAYVTDNDGKIKVITIVDDK